MFVLRYPHLGAFLIAFVVRAAAVGQFPSWSRGSLHPEDASIPGAAEADLASAGVTASGNIVAAAAAAGSGPWQAMRRMIRSEKAPASLASLGTLDTMHAREALREQSDAEAQVLESEHDAEAGTDVLDVAPMDKMQEKHAAFDAVSAQQKIALEEAGCDFSAAACQTLAQSLGLQIGGNGWPFQGNYSTQGCFAYNSGDYKNVAYYGLVNGQEITSLSQSRDVLSPKYRPNGYGCADVKVPLLNTWTVHSEGFGTPSFTVNEGVCTLFGLAKIDKIPSILTVGELPSYCRPNKELTFAQLSGWGNGRVTVGTDGKLTWVWATKSPVGGNWLSFNGIRFTVSAADEKLLTLTASWASMDTKNVTYQIMEGLCILQGSVVPVGAKMVVGSTSPSVYNSSNGAPPNDTATIAVLPTTCRPSKRLLFNVFTNYTSDMARVDVLPDGRVIWITPDSNKQFLSLTGISFSIGLAGQQPLELRAAGGYQAFGGEYGAPTFVLTNGLCIVEGIVKVSEWKEEIALLPRTCLPEADLVFDVKVGACTARVDVLKTGIVKYKGGCQTHTWISLTGIIFEPQRPPAGRVNQNKNAWLYGAWHDWSSWSTCTANCAGGSQNRTRMAKGLLGEYYYFTQTNKLPTSEALDKYTPDIVRQDLQVDFPSISSRWQGLPNTNQFAARWSGFISITTAGSYTFSITSDDGSILFINGNALPLGTPNPNVTNLTIDNDGWHAMVKKSGTVTLSAGLHPIRLLFNQGGGGLGMILAYQGPDTSQVYSVVPARVLSHDVPAAYTGLLGEYFYFPQGNSLPNLAGVRRNFVRTDQVLDFTATAGSQWLDLPLQNDLAVRWTGELLITNAGNYSFDIKSDDGVQMWIGKTVLPLKSCTLCLGGELMNDPSNKTVISDGIHTATTVSATVTLAAGYHMLRVEYFNKADDSSITLSYDGPDVPTDANTRRRRIVVPSKVLRLPSADYTDKTKETQSCNTQGCPVDCVVANWSNWTTCSKTCGGGVSYHERAVITPAQNGGKPCPNTTTESKPCGDTPCPVNCVMSDWAQWTDCSKTCGGGSKERTRVVKVQAAFNGTACGTDFKQTVPCGPANCPVDCDWNKWSDWTHCAATCGSATTTRTRNVSKAAAFGGRNCTGNATETKACSSIPCPGDCVWDTWTNWTACSKSCGLGQMTRTRQIKVPNTNGGKPCKGSNNETEGCNPQGCPVDCKWSDWTPYTNCSKTCGGGVKVRTRNASGTPAWGGKSCDGDARQEEICNSQGCPVDCKWSSWSAYSNCSATCAGGTKFKTRTVASAALNGGKDCNLSQAIYQEKCNTHPCPINCVWNNWSSWSNCTKECGGGISVRNRTVKVQPQYGGTNCTGDAGQQTKCNTDGCKVDCKWGNWSNWSSCSATCGGGVRRQTRQKLAEAAFGGKECQGGNVTQEACNTAACPVDCTWGTWENWTACSVTCGEGVKYRVRAQFTAQNNGKPCVGLPREDSGCRQLNQSACPTTTTRGPTTTTGTSTSTKASSTTTAVTTTKATTTTSTTARTTSTTLTGADGSILIPSNSTTVKGDVLLKVPNPDAFAKDVAAIAAMTDTVSTLTKVAVGLVQVKITSVPALIQLNARRLSTRDGLVDVAYSIVLSKEEATTSVLAGIQNTLSVSNLAAIQAQVSASLAKINGTSGAAAAASIKVESVIAATVTVASSKDTANGGPVASTASSTTKGVVKEIAAPDKGATTAKPTALPTNTPINISKWQNMSKNSSPWGSPGGASPSAHASWLVTLALATALFAMALPRSHEA